MRLSVAALIYPEANTSILALIAKAKRAEKQENMEYASHNGNCFSNGNDRENFNDNKHQNTKHSNNKSNCNNDNHIQSANYLLFRDPTYGGFLRTCGQTACRPSRESPPQDWG
ncbi:hypothetical protein DSO57_1032313 [Entomophthora muscae]|uniref:Uncharacterized protein n=1 Tax=Entomophthora muscae TaxID=34485 RepID=A0ACC2TMF7_9FUNG|nr:hypothetical protein DSO57_1032313 [Entomophthora muscae]